MKQALAMIETKGFVAAMEAADAALKSASVELLGWKKSAAGWSPYSSPETWRPPRPPSIPPWTPPPKWARWNPPPS